MFEESSGFQYFSLISILIDACFFFFFLFSFRVIKVGSGRFGSV